MVYRDRGAAQRRRVSSEKSKQILVGAKPPPSLKILATWLHPPLLGTRYVRQCHSGMDSRTLFRQRTILRQNYITTSDPCRNIVCWMHCISTAHYIATGIRSRTLTLHLYHRYQFDINQNIFDFHIFIHTFTVYIFIICFYILSV